MAFSRQDIAEWFVISFSRGSFWPRNWTWVSCITHRLFTAWAVRKVQRSCITKLISFVGKPENCMLMFSSKISCTFYGIHSTLVFGWRIFFLNIEEYTPPPIFLHRDQLCMSWIVEKSYPGLPVAAWTFMYHISNPYKKLLSRCNAAFK